ncbi:hypothetical protein Poly59_23060 [Rubripirellula reticaptiva]|uniref:Uncharacterized protein n=1 Tax=Rubripirellula reticaptiva TaxID=2528013 RepID=A0A5C6F2E7_9BACT|nr:hypothetical protein Poly59_23060 [Rubripirellula reticaptiva]
MPAHQLSKPQGVKLFETRSGPVRAVVIGPTIGIRWRILKYFRLVKSTKVPGEWLEVGSSWRPSENSHLAKCVAAVQCFLDSEDDA